VSGREPQAGPGFGRSAGNARPASDAPSDADVPSSGALTRIGVRLLVALAFVSLAGALVYSFVVPYLPAQREYRARGLEVIRAEAAQLAPYDGSTLANQANSTEPERGPVLFLWYALPSRLGSCRDAHAHYTQVAPQQGWAVVAPTTTSPQATLVETRYQKVAHGYTLSLYVNCEVDKEESGSDYELILSAK
jgi:hypothetical protein